MVGNCGSMISYRLDALPLPNQLYQR